MRLDLDKLADLVVLTVKTALAPVLERVAAAEARLTDMRDLSTRVVAVETKAATPITPEPVVFDAAPILARVTALEAQLSACQDRVLVVETKAAIPVPVVEAHDVDLSPVLDRVSKVEMSIGSMAVDVVKEIGAIRERVSVAEVRALVPGPAGKDGIDGKDGQHGKDGVDGLGFDDLGVEFDGDRTLAVKFVRGDRVKSFPIVLPYQRQQGVFIEGKSYTQGDVVTWGGSQWHANEETTTKPGDGSKAWTLIVKRGRDGRDGKDAPPPLPVLKVGA